MVQAGTGLVGDDESSSLGGAASARVESSYIINLRDLDIKHVKDFVFVHGEVCTLYSAKVMFYGFCIYS